ncbi:MAG: hypothetical protein IPP40_13300 [bacterium]|nr:hypothetical protein [bacterium]
MKRVLIAIVVLCCSICAIAAGQSQTFPFEVDSPKAEIVRLEKLIAEANANGQTPNPLWTERLNELLPPPANVPPSSAFDVSAFQAQGGFAPGAVIRPQQLTPLEQQIKSLEFQIRGGLSNNAVDGVTFSNLKDQLNALYPQRSASQRPAAIRWTKATTLAPVLLSPEYPTPTAAQPLDRWIIMLPLAALRTERRMSSMNSRLQQL